MATGRSSRSRSVGSSRTGLRVVSGEPQEKSARKAGLDEQSLLGVAGYCVRFADMVLDQWYDVFIRRETGIRQVEFAILNLLGDNENVTQKQLSDVLWISPPNLAVVIDRMQMAGLVLRRLGPDDGRSHWVALTRKGVAMLEKVRACVAVMEAAQLEHLTQAELRTLLRLLAKLRDGLPPAETRKPAKRARG
jgi:DNA-binding MarR family transcriptional regulator